MSRARLNSGQMHSILVAWETFYLEPFTRSTVVKSLKRLVLTGAALLALTGIPFASAAESAPPPPAPATADPDAPPDAAALQRLARRALFEATGVRPHVGPVILKEKLADGSWLVEVTLESGRPVRGRLYRHRRRFRIVVDRRDLFSPEQTVKIVK